MLVFINCCACGMDSQTHRIHLICARSQFFGPLEKASRYSVPIFPSPFHLWRGLRTVVKKLQGARSLVARAHRTDGWIEGFKRMTKGAFRGPRNHVFFASPPFSPPPSPLSLSPVGTAPLP